MAWWLGDLEAWRSEKVRTSEAELVFLEGGGGRAESEGSPPGEGKWTWLGGAGESEGSTPGEGK